MKSYLSTVEVFNTLPEEVKNKALSIFGAYSEVNVSREYGVWEVNTCSCLRNHYAPDHLVHFFSKEEIKKEYKEQIEAEERRYDEECEGCDWESFNN